MDEQQKDMTPEEQIAPEEAPVEETPVERYVPRPKWQVWGARIGLVLFLLLILMYYINMMRGGI